MTEQTQTWPLDMSVLTQTAGPRAAQLLPQLIPIYLEDGDLLLSWLQEACQTKDAIKLHQATHRLKGNSASMGALTIATLADQLQTYGKVDDWQMAAQSLADLAEEYAKVKSALLTLVSQVE